MSGSMRDPADSEPLPAIALADAPAPAEGASGGAQNAPNPFAPALPREVARLLGLCGEWPYVERRRGIDRRGRPTSMISRFVLHGGRARGRRRGEEKNIYVDRYAPGDVYLATTATTILVLNILDAWLTIVYLGYGGSEANPVAQKLLEMGTAWFLGVKGFAVGGCLLFLILHKTFALVKPALRCLTVFYGLLLVYHVYLQISALLQGLA
jgi:hypothetical protein